MLSILLIVIFVIITIFVFIVLVINLESYITDKISRNNVLKSLKRGDKLYKCCFVVNNVTGDLIIDRDSIVEETISAVFTGKFLGFFILEKIYTESKQTYYQQNIMNFKAGSLWRKEDIDFFINTLNNEKTISEIMNDDKQLIIYSLKMLLQQSLKYNKDTVSKKVALLIKQIEGD